MWRTVNQDIDPSLVPRPVQKIGPGNEAIIFLVAIREEKTTLRCVKAWLLHL